MGSLHDTGPRRRGSSRRASAASPIATASSSTASGSTPARTSQTRRPRSRTSSRPSVSRPRRRWRQARCSSRRSTGGRTASDRCCRLPQPSRRASRRTWTSSARRSRQSFSLRLGLVDTDTNLAEALDRWELSLFQHEPFRSEQLRAALDAALGSTWPLRASILLETQPEARAELHRDLTLLADGAAASRLGGPGRPACARRGAASRRAAELVARLDRELLGVPSERPVRVAS